MTKDLKQIRSVSETKGVQKGLFLLCILQGEREKGRMKSFEKEFCKFPRFSEKHLLTNQESE